MVNATPPINSTALPAQLLQSAGALNGAPAPAGFAAGAKVADFSALLNLAGDGSATAPALPAAVPAAPMSVPAMPTAAKEPAAPAMPGKPTGKTLPLADPALPEAPQTELFTENRDAPEQTLADAAMIVEALTTTFPLAAPVLAVNQTAAPQSNNAASRSPRAEVAFTASPAAVPMPATAALSATVPPLSAAPDAASRATRAATLLSPGVAATKFAAIEIVQPDGAQARLPVSAPASPPTTASTMPAPRTLFAAAALPEASASVIVPAQVSPPAEVASASTAAAAPSTWMPPRTVRVSEAEGTAPKSGQTTTAMPAEASSLNPPLPATTAPAIMPELRISAPAPASATPLPASAPPAHDFAALVDRIAEARETGAGNMVRTTIRHADFGPVALQFRADEGLTSVTFASSDPAFAPAVQAAAASAMSAQGGEDARREQQPRQEQQPSGQQSGQSPQQAAAGQTGTGSQPSPQQAAQSRAEDEARNSARNGGNARHSRDAGTDETSSKPDRRSGIYA